MSNPMRTDQTAGQYLAGIATAAVGLLVAVAVGFFGARAPNPAAFLASPIAMIAIAGAAGLTLVGFILMIAGAASSPAGWDESMNIESGTMTIDHEGETRKVQNGT